MVSSPPTVRVASSDLADSAAQAAQLKRQLGESLATVLVFSDPARARAPDFMSAFTAEFAGTPVVGCTTAGELDGRGYVKGNVVALGLPSSDFHVASTLLRGLKDISLERIRSAVVEVEAQLTARGRSTSQGCFAMVLVDGLSMAEERVTQLLQSVLGKVPLLGGSAGDGLLFRQTGVLFDGKLVSDAAVLIIVSTDRPFRVLKTQHFLPTTTKLVVTGARPQERLVTELNGFPAAGEYARLVKANVEELGPPIFAKNPLMVRMGGEWYVRSIQQVTPEGGLKVYCSVDEGQVLTLGRGIALVDDLEALLARTHDELGSLSVVLGYDCILRRLEAEATGDADKLKSVFSRYRVMGFSTYGEQHGAAHINQTFTGVAIG